MKIYISNYVNLPNLGSSDILKVNVYRVSEKFEI